MKQVKYSTEDMFNIFDKFNYYIICKEPLYYHKIYCLVDHNVEVTIDLSDLFEPDVYLSDYSDIDPNDLGQILLNCEIGTTEIVDGFDYLVLLEWIESELTDNEPGFNNKSDEFNESSDESDQSDSDKTKSTRTRELIIYTWGKAYRKRAPKESQRNFNACVLNGRRKGVNLKKLDGRSPDVQKVVESGTRFWNWSNSVVNNIETNDLHTISVNCTKGRHRSVAGSILLKKYYYPCAKIIHVELKSLS